MTDTPTPKRIELPPPTDEQRAYLRSILEWEQEGQRMMRECRCLLQAIGRNPRCPYHFPDGQPTQTDTPTKEQLVERAMMIAENLDHDVLCAGKGGGCHPECTNLNMLQALDALVALLDEGERQLAAVDHHEDCQYNDDGTFSCVHGCPVDGYVAHLEARLEAAEEDRARLRQLMDRWLPAFDYLHRCRTGTMSAEIELRRQARRLEVGQPDWARLIDCLADGIGAVMEYVGCTCGIERGSSPLRPTYCKLHTPENPDDPWLSWNVTFDPNDYIDAARRGEESGDA